MFGIEYHNWVLLLIILSHNTIKDASRCCRDFGDGSRAAAVNAVNATTVFMTLTWTNFDAKKMKL